MSIKTLEKDILNELRQVTDNSKLKLKNIKEWSTSEVKAEPGEKLIRLPRIGVNVAYTDGD